MKQKESRTLIRNLCSSLNFEGSERAIFYFERAMAKGSFRWGRESKLVSAVTVIISMTEAKKGEALGRIAVSTSTEQSRRRTHRLADTD
jgi:hypothetical protein